MTNSGKNGQDNNPKYELGETINERDLLATTSGTHQAISDIKTVSDDEIIEITESDEVPAFSNAQVYNADPDSNMDMPRFDIGEILGSGGGGSVYNLIDNNLNRTTAIKFLSEKKKNSERVVNNFMNEALLTSHLDHPHIPPIYNLDIGTEGQLYYTMKKIKGIPLSNVIKESPEDIHTDAKKTVINKINTVNELVSIMLTVCETIAYAHSRGIVHRDIKPDNIMVGDYGELYLVDWGIAFHKKNRDKQSGHMSGTPIYMSPEQARREIADERSDIYCIGTTFYHLLFKQIPFDLIDQDIFWEDKRIGKIRKLDQDDLSKVPAPLAAIILKCLEPNPNKRYQSANDLANDLKHLQSGAMVSAYRYSLSETIKYHLKHSSKHIAWAAMILLSILAISGFIVYQYQREVADWGDPILVETFNSGENWKEHWRFRDNDSVFEIKDERLVTSNGPEFIWVYKEYISGSIAIEFEGENLPESDAGDLSVILLPNLEEFSGGRSPINAHYLQHGALHNTCSMIEGPEGRMEFFPFTLKKGVKYHIRGEFDGKHLRLYLDGELICSHELILPLNGGYIGIYGFHDYKAFDNIKIYNKDLPEITNITATGDQLLENEQYALAANRYQQIIQSHQGTKISEEALYKLGLCHYKLNQEDKAIEIWDTLSTSRYRDHIHRYRWKILYTAQEHLSLLEHMHNAFTHTEHPRPLMLEWSIHLQDAAEKGKIDLIRKLLTIRDKYFPNDQIFSQQVYLALRVIGKPEKALVLFTNQKKIINQALHESGRYKEIINRNNQSGQANIALLTEMGHYQEVIKNTKDPLSSHLLTALIRTGQLKRAEELFSDQPAALLRVRSEGRGDFRGIIEDAEVESTEWRAAQLWSGNESIYLVTTQQLSSTHNDNQFDAQLSLLLKDYIKNGQTDLKPIKDLCARAPGSAYYGKRSLFSVHFLSPILSYLAGDKVPLTNNIDHIQKNKKFAIATRLWHCCKLLSGEISRDAFMKQPNKSFIEHDYLLFYALQMDLHNRRSIAHQHYSELRALPAYKKYFNATIKRFVDFRIKELE